MALEYGWCEKDGSVQALLHNVLDVLSIKIALEFSALATFNN